MNNNKIKNMLDEIDSFIPEQNKTRIIEVRGDNIITSAINLIKDIRKNFNEDEAEYLKKKILNAIRSEDPNKFCSKIKKVQNHENK